MRSVGFPNSCLMVFAKAPEPGRVKTRLVPAITKVEAARLQSRLIVETLDMAHREPLCAVQLWCSPSIGHPDFKNALNRYPISLHLQIGKGLGERMAHAVSVNLDHFAAVVLIGCDCPSLKIQDLSDAFSALYDGCDVVLGPSEDGGYALIGMNRPLPELFREMPWGTAGVLAETRSRIAELGLRCFQTREQWDIDRPADLRRYLDSASGKNRSL